MPLLYRRSLAIAALATAANAQNPWPTPDLRLIVPFPPGGTTDVVARLPAAEIGRRIGHTMVVENIAGAGSLVGTRDVREYFRRVRAARPGRPFRRAGNGTSTHPTGELVIQPAGLGMQHIPFRGAAPAMTALIAGGTDILFDKLPTALPEIQAGSVVAMAVTSGRRLPELPDGPALGELGAEFGLAGWESEAWFGLSAHASISEASLARLVAAAEGALTDPTIRRQLAERGTTPAGGGPAPHAALIRSEVGRWGRVVREGNIRPD